MGKEDYVSVPLYDNEAVYPVKAPKTKAAAVVLPTKRGGSSACCCVKILIGLFVVLAVIPFCLLTVAAISGYVYVANKVKAVTVTERRVLPIVVMPESELEMVKDRVTLFWADLAADRIPSVQDLIITADEINGFIAMSDFMRGNAYVHLEQDKLTFETSLPMAQSFLPGGNGRYFVSTTIATAKSTSDDNTLALEVDAPIEAFQGQLIKVLLQFSMDENNNKHHVMTCLDGKAFGMEFDGDKTNLFDLFDDSDDIDTKDFSRAIDNLATITLLTDKIVFTARNPTDVVPTTPTEDSSSETKSRLSPWHLLRRLF